MKTKFQNTILCTECDNHAGTYCRQQHKGFPHARQCIGFTDGTSASVLLLNSKIETIKKEEPDEIIVWQDDKKTVALSYVNIPKE